MTEKRQRMISAMKYILLVIIVGYLVILMLYASGSKRAFSEVSKALSSVLDSKELVQMDDQMLKRNYGLNSQITRVFCIILLRPVFQQRKFW